MATLRTSTWPWFVLAAVLVIVGIVLLSGDAQALLVIAAAFVVLAAAIRGVGLALRDDPVRQRLLARGLVGNLMRETKAAKKRDHAHPPEREPPLPSERRRWP